jgi:hypothetical protein
MLDLLNINPITMRSVKGLFKIKKYQLFLNLIFGCLLSYSSFGQWTTDMERKQLKGNVKSMVQVRFSENDTTDVRFVKKVLFKEDRVILSDKYGDNDFLEKDIRFLRDGDGRIFKEENYFNGLLVGYENFKYDLNKNIVKSESYDKEGVLNGIKEFTYSSNNELIEFKEIYPGVSSDMPKRWSKFFLQKWPPGCREFSW